VVIQWPKTMNELKHPPDKSLPPPKGRDDATEDDGAVLRAVRAFLLDDDVIGALDSDDEESRLIAFSGDSSSANESSGSVIETPPRKAATKSPPARPRMINRSRVRLQNEIFSLRQKSIALERRLAQIQRDGSDAASAKTGSTAGAPTPSTPWQTAALEQRERLEAAEREREKLRKSVNECKQAVKRVRQFLRRQILKQSTEAKSLLLGTPHQTALHLGAPIGFEDISEHLDSMYAQLDSVFQDKDLNSVTRVTDELNKMRVKNEDSLNMSLEYLKSRVLPFDVDTTAKAVWFYHTAKAAELAVHVEEGSLDTDDVLRRVTVSTVSLPHFKGTVHGRWEARRFLDKDRIVILHCSIYHRFEGASEGMDGLRIHVLNWTVISPARDEHLRTVSGRSVSHIDSFEVAMACFAEDSFAQRDTPKNREELKAFCVKSMEYTNAFERQTIENILLSGE
jgi:hypothetical protein